MNLFLFNDQKYNSEKNSDLGWINFYLSPFLLKLKYLRNRFIENDVVIFINFFLLIGQIFLLAKDSF